MKKRMFALLLALVLAFSLVPVSAAAASDLMQAAFFPSGKMMTPDKAPYLEHSANSSYGDYIEFYYYIPGDLLTLGDAYEKAADFDTEFDVDYGYSLKIQVDGKLDNGPWHYTSGWDTNDLGDDLPDYLVSASDRFINCGVTDRLNDFESSWLTYIDDGDPAADAGWLYPGLTSEKNSDGNTVWHYDLANHSFTYRYRFLLYYTIASTGETVYLSSGWSPETTIGKGGGGSAPTQLKDLPAPVLSEFSLVSTADGAEARYYVDFPEAYAGGILYYDTVGGVFEPYYLQAEIKVDKGDWKEVYTANAASLTNGFRATGSGDIVSENSKVQIRVRVYDKAQGKWSPYSNVVGTLSTWANASSWAENALGRADAADLIPDCLKGADMRKPITRAEFAAVCVKTFESLSGRAATPVAGDPFTDTKNADVLKAYNLGVVSGYPQADGSYKFEPNELLNREMGASMLYRVYRNLQRDVLGDPNYVPPFTQPTAFKDDVKISGWAKDHVYFMVANGIISGYPEDGTFRPKNTTSAEEATNYATLTREAAMIIAVKMYENLAVG